MISLPITCGLVHVHTKENCSPIVSTEQIAAEVSKRFAGSDAVPRLHVSSKVNNKRGRLLIAIPLVCCFDFTGGANIGFAFPVQNLAFPVFVGREHAFLVEPVWMINDE